MKIPFSIKYRPQIESGEYKVETHDGRPVRIICWDRTPNVGEDKDLTLCVLIPHNIGEAVYYYNHYGKSRLDGRNDLFIITPEPEPFTKLEKAVFDMLVERTNETTISETQARKYGPIFMEIAKDEIYSHESLVEYAEKAKAEGKAEALKDLPRWRKWDTGACGNSDGHPIALVFGAGGIRFISVLGAIGEKYIMLNDLKKLPGFNE